MKLKKRVLSALMCVCLVICLFTGTAMADTTPTGSITVQDQSGTNATVAGKTLNLFKIFDATTDGENISYDWIEKDGVKLYYTFFFGENGVTGKTSGTIHDVVDYINGIKDDSFAFSQMAAKLHEYIHDENIGYTQSAVVPKSETSCTFSALALGYYLIYDATEIPDDSPAVRSAAMLAHPGENKVISLKADRPHIVKYVDYSGIAYDEENTDKADWKLGTTASIGDVVTFKIVTAIPNHDLYGDSYLFEITDEMSNNLELIEESFNVIVTEPATVDEEIEAEKVLDYSIITNSANLADDVDFKITLKNITELQQDTVVEIIYQAKVLNTAEFKNLNTAILTYSNDPHSVDNPETPDVDERSTGSVEASVNVLLWQFTLTKYMEDANGTPSFIRLGEAEFEVYSIDNLDEPLTFTVDTEEKGYAKYIYDPEGETRTLKTINTGDGTTDIGYTDGGSLGQILIFGLGEGTYVIRETKAPDGYQIAKGDFEFTVTDTIGPAGAISNATITEATRTETPGQFTRVMIQEAAQKYYIGITNAPGSALPETGGMGTTLFMVLGVVIMAGAVSILLVRRRSRAV
ncbi:MAG: isopeptide-forming domain-containing fimbrial protein [Eubacterium sp.]|nr:isopeptide-forming domain-containing fimbrial protein [Eubacterium sp.]